MSPRAAWRDELTITVKFLEGGTGGDVDEAWVWQAHGSLEDADLPVREIEATLTAGDGLRFWPYIVERRESIINWGASGASEAIIISLLANAAVIAVEPELRATFDRIRKALRSKPALVDHAPTADEIEQRARWYAVRHLELAVEPDALSLTSIEQNLASDEWQVALDGADIRYTVSLEFAEGLVSFVKIKRENL